MKHCHNNSLVFMLLLALSLSLGSQEADSRNIKVIARTAQGERLELYKDSHALVIGVGDYQDEAFRDLRGALQDVRQVSAALEAQGFQVSLLENPTKAEIDSAMDDFKAGPGLEVNNRLLFYYAGHGATLTNPATGDSIGYIIPADAPSANTDMSGFQRTAISLRDFESYSSQIGAKHVLFVFDCCFSGAVFEVTRSDPEAASLAIRYETAQPTRQFICAGEADEEVPDKSIFKRYFLAGLQGAADANRDRYVTGMELGMYIRPNVINDSKSTQHPQYGKVRHARLKGDFVFVLERDSTITVHPPLQTPVIRDFSNLRSTPVDNLNERDVQLMLRQYNFFDRQRNLLSEGIPHQYEPRVINGDSIVGDAATGLMWQQGGSPDRMGYVSAKRYIRELNQQKFAGFDDWRLPTLEEAMSLMEPKSVNVLYINPLFDATQVYIWTADRYSASGAWTVNFGGGTCYDGHVDDDLYVRAVRSR